MMIKEATFNFYKNQCNLMEEFVSPLKPFGVYYFSFVRIFNTGKVVFFCNHHDWLIKKVENKLFDYRGFIPNSVENEILSHYHYHLYTGQEYENNKVLGLLFETNRWNSIDLYNKGAEYINILHFSGTRENTGIINFFINNLPLLKYYFRLFQAQFEDTIDNALNYKHYIQIDEMSESNDNEINQDLFSINQSSLEDDKKLISLIPSIGSVPLIVDGKKIKISSREYSCLMLLAKGKSIKEIARSLDLSPRTIEVYVQHIRQKTGLYYKSELIDLYHKNFY